MENNPKSSMAGQPAGNDALGQKVAAYKRIYFLLMLTGTVMLGCVAVYIALLFTDKENAYHALDSNTAMGKVVAANDSGTMIAFSAFNKKAHTTSILVSDDSGRHFEEKGGPWANKYTDTITSMAFGRDNKSIVAVSGKNIYIKAAGEDSFSHISLFSFQGQSSAHIINGFCFVPVTDTVYVYTNDGFVLSINYKAHDSLLLGRLKNIAVIKSMAVSPNKNIYVMDGFWRPSGGTLKRGVFLNCAFTDVRGYASTDFDNKKNLIVPGMYAPPTLVNDTLPELPIDSSANQVQQTAR